MAGTFILEGAPKLKIPRRSARLRVESLIYLDLGPENGGFPINISEEGVAFQGIRPLQKGEEISIAFKLDGVPEPVTATARIVWLTDSRKAGALQFVDLPESSRSQIRSWIELQRKAESPQHSADMKISPAKARAKADDFTPAPVLAAVVASRRERTATIAAPTPVSSPAPAPTLPAEPPKAAEAVPPSAAVAATQAQPEGKKDPVAPVSNIRVKRPANPPATVPLSPRRVKWVWSISYGFGLAASMGIAIVGGALLWPYRATIFQRLHGNQALTTVSPSAPVASPSVVDQAPIEPPDDLPMKDPAQWTPLGNTLQSPAVPSPLDVSMKGASRVVRDAAPATPPMNARKAPHAPLASGAALRPQSPSPVSEPAKSRQPVAVALPVVDSAYNLPAAGATAAKPAPPENKPAASPVSVTGSVEIVSDPYPSIRMPAGSQGTASRLGTSLQIGRLASKVEPIYPPEALRQKMTGAVKLHVVIGANGAVQSAEVTDGPALLAEAALRAVAQWRYDPTMLGGTAIEVEEGVTLVFRITNSPAPTN